MSIEINASFFIEIAKPCLREFQSTTDTYFKLEASKRLIRHLQIIPKPLGMVPEGLMEKHEQDRKSVFKNKFFQQKHKEATYIKSGMELGQSSTTGWEEKNGHPNILYNDWGFISFLTHCRIPQVIGFDLFFC